MPSVVMERGVAGIEGYQLLKVIQGGVEQRAHASTFIMMCGNGRSGRAWFEKAMTVMSAGNDLHERIGWSSCQRV